MKSIIIYIIATLSVFSVKCSPRVLSIGIGEYPENSGWHSLGADNDAELIKTTFDKLTLIANEKATHDDILKSLNRFILQSGVGDTVILHFSGHGQQIIGRDSHNEVNGVDEALVAYDAARQKSPSYCGEAHITDDVFGRYIEELREKVGPKGLVVAVIDACHSDSMDRTGDICNDSYRGTDEIFGAETLPPDSLEKLKDVYYNKDTGSIIIADDLANVVWISACATHQRNYEINIGSKQYGSLTYYFCKAFQDEGLSDMMAFLSTLRKEMVSNKVMKIHQQTPVINNSLGWVAPPDKTVKKTSTYSTVIDGDSNGDNNGPITHNRHRECIYWCSIIITGIILSLILFIICRKKRK